MRYIELWEQGYDCTGQSAPDHRAGTFWARDYEDACQGMLEQRLKTPTGGGPAT